MLCHLPDLRFRIQHRSILDRKTQCILAFIHDPGHIKLGGSSAPFHGRDGQLLKLYFPSLRILNNKHRIE
ncbi:hypothetical protein D3C77_275270 [compost metagenome]